MSLRWRPMQPRDVRTCVDIIASHPVIGPRYGAAIDDLPKAWLRILGHDAAITAIFEEVKGQQVEAWGVGVVVIIHDEVLRQLKTPPLSWFGPALARRIARGDSLLLSDRELSEANSSSGLTGLNWEGTIRAGLETRSELMHHVMTAFVQRHRGYLWKELIAPQAESADRMRWTFDTGGRLWDPEGGRYVESPQENLHEIVREPHIIGATRETHAGKPAPWVGALFEYSPPQIGFSRAERQLLVAALDSESGTDRELAAALRVSLPTVKKTWLSIYRRTGSSLPDLIPEDAHHHADAQERGKEKRRRLLAYLRQHLEELRPYSRRGAGNLGGRERASLAERR